MEDRNFDDIAEKFARNIYGTTKGRLRQTIVWQDLDNLLAAHPGKTWRILDAGGGEGQTACRLAAQGHHVTLCDLSQEMVNRARACARAKGVSENMTFVHSPVQQIDEHLAGPVDLILFHAVLEWIADPISALKILWDVLIPGGTLSLMFYNINGLVLHNMVAGNFAFVEAGMPKRKKRTLSPDSPLAPAQVYHWLNALGFKITGKTGVRIFHDYLREKHHQQDKFEALLSLEKRYCHEEPWISLGRYIHVTAQKP